MSNGDPIASVLRDMRLVLHQIVEALSGMRAEPMRGHELAPLHVALRDIASGLSRVDERLTDLRPSPPSRAKAVAPWAALIVSLMALYVASRALQVSSYQASVSSEQLETVRKFYAATLQPDVWVNFYHNKEGVGWHYGNHGPGHAIVKTFRVEVDGVPIERYCDLLRKLGAQRVPKVRMSTIPGGRLTPGHEQHMFDVRFDDYDGDTEAFRKDTAVLKAFYSRVRPKICFCSVLGECWTTTGVIAEPGDCDPALHLPPRVEMNCSL